MIGPETKNKDLKTQHTGSNNIIKIHTELFDDDVRRDNERNAALLFT